MNNNTTLVIGNIVSTGEDHLAMVLLPGDHLTRVYTFNTQITRNLLTESLEFVADSFERLIHPPIVKHTPDENLDMVVKYAFPQYAREDGIIEIIDDLGGMSESIHVSIPPTSSVFVTLAGIEKGTYYVKDGKLSLLTLEDDSRPSRSR